MPDIPAIIPCKVNLFPTVTYRPILFLIKKWSMNQVCWPQFIENENDKKVKKGNKLDHVLFY
jgi:hypothetical protein